MSLKEACKRLALGDPEVYEKFIKIGLILLCSSLILFILPKSLELLPSLQIPQLVVTLIPFLSIVLMISSIVLLLIGYMPILKLKSHLAGLEAEAPFAVLAVNIGVHAGLPPIRAFEELSRLDVLKHVSFEVRRIVRDSYLGRRHLSEQLLFEAKSATGMWAKLLRTLITVERIGGDPKLIMRDLMREALRDLRIGYDALARKFQSMISASNVLFGAMPMMLTVLFTLLASESVVGMVVSFMLVNLVLGLVYLMIVDTQVPKTVSYRPVYARILVKWLPLGVGLGVLSYMGFIRLPISLVAPKAVSISIGALAFSVPAYMEFRVHSQVVDELLENLPTILRDIADEVERGFSPHQALERLYENAAYGKYTDRFIALIVKRARVLGSLRDAIMGIESLLPIQMRLALWLLTLGEELGATSGVYQELADAILEYYLALRSFKRGCQGYRLVGIGMVALTLGLTTVLFTTLINRIALVGQLVESASAGGLISLPFSIVSPEVLPRVKDWIYASMSVN
ncbi:MAG: type II secretion system F family protein, partial [Armatimonadetes bacterium]|nr:type II secretion system F family protein [Armatimonadota bacterium]